ncbi:hypothetical protein KC365_g38 [Hortaea werneckii]|nr:hypothetical protein KC365_g38 [Hortaea werneckii]
MTIPILPLLLNAMPTQLLPVMKADASLARYTHSPLRSLTSPSLFCGVRSFQIFFCASSAGTRFRAPTQRRATSAGHGGNVDDVAALSSLDHLVADGLRDQEGAGDIDVDEVAELPMVVCLCRHVGAISIESAGVEIAFLCVNLLGDASSVDEYVQCTVMVGDVLNDLVHTLTVANVCAVEADVHAIQDGNAAASDFCKSLGHVQAEATAATDETDDGDLVRKRELGQRRSEAGKQVRVEWLGNGHVVSTRRRDGTGVADGHLDVLLDAAAVLIVNDRDLWLVGTRTSREGGALQGSSRDSSRAKSTTLAGSFQDGAVRCPSEGSSFGRKLEENSR